MSNYRPLKIISGGQTGVDIGALVGAKRSGIPTGGTAPKGFETEHGPKPAELKPFRLVECDIPGYPPRTKANVCNSDATLILSKNQKSRGTISTKNYCITYQKPYLVISPYANDAVDKIRYFLATHRPNVLNIAGNRESIAPGIANATVRLVVELFYRKQSEKVVQIKKRHTGGLT